MRTSDKLEDILNDIEDPNEEKTIIPGTDYDLEG